MARVLHDHWIKKVSITGGPAITLGPVTATSLGASWGDDNSIVFATNDPTPVCGACRPTVAAEVLTTPDAAQRESDHGFPSMLPGGRGVLFTIRCWAGRTTRRWPFLT